MRFLLIVITGLLASVSVADESAQFNTLIDSYWANELRENPFTATHSGVHDYDDQVPGVTPEDHARRERHARDVLNQLGSIDLKELSETEQLSAQLLRFILQNELALAEFQQWRIPILSDAGFHSEATYLPRATPFRDVDDYRVYLQRLAKLPAYLEQNVENMRQGLRDGYTQPVQILDDIIPSFTALVTDSAEDHPLFEPFLRMPASVDKAQQESLTADARRVFEKQLIPAYASTARFISGEYRSKAVKKVGLMHLPKGKQQYRALVKYYTTLADAEPEAIHALGLAEVARIRAEMDEVMARAEFAGSFAEFLKFLRSDPQFYAKSPQALLERAAWIAKDVDGKLPGFFGKLPRQPYSVEPVPDELAANYTTGRYVGAPLQGSVGGQYWVNTYALETRPLYQLTALTLHEAVPGHHLQGALAKEMKNVPEFRKGFYPHAFGEGWGLYAEKLGVEMGVYQTPYEHFGRLSYEMWRACRLVIDTGLHSKGWTRQQANDYLASNTALSKHNVKTEVDRYISWPGQALAYKMGELTIWELRAKAKKELGNKFDIRDFHDAVLAEGGLPLDLLRRQIDAYIHRANSSR